MKSQNLYPPIFWTYPNLQDAVRVVLLNEKVATEWEKVNFYLEKNKYINNGKAREITRIVQVYKMSKLLDKWVKNGSLIKIVPPTGYVRGIKYRLPSLTEIKK